MARGRHRSSALHRVLIPAALGSVALLCAAVAWLVGGPPADRDALVLRVLVAVAAFAAVAGAALLRRWDADGARRLARERAEKARLSWRAEERQAEVEESQELVTALEEKIRGKRGELGRLRSEHADLLRRYATAESERARALEGRRRLALEASQPARALSAAPADHRTQDGAPTPLTYRLAHDALIRLARTAPREEPRPEPEAAPEPEPEPVNAAEPAPVPASDQSERRQLPPAPRKPAPIQRTGGGFDFFGTGTPGKP
ncbi:hypothetical protein [Streptomyces avicenniae]|uniref:hypothetical protein n=1 Tax=Streptomyces avicenniae TaxID=500153 RepID=UPI00069A1489|nr:hypothetical protein [Streptomyces avicenniae]